MSYFDEASLVMIPSGYKTSKVYSVLPTDGSGDLTFSRSNDTATRVNSDGLIEKVRTNRALYSQDFSNAAWTKGNCTVTGSQPDPNGGTSAFLVTDNATNDLHYFYQFVTPEAGEFTFSFYAKANTLTHCAARIYDTLVYDSAIFNLSNGTKGSGDGSIESVGNGWYRISLTKTLSSSFAYFNILLSNGSDISYSGSLQSIYVFGAQYESGVTTDYIATTSAAVSVGPVANLPRLDYLDSSCPRLLLEPQRTNLAVYSEQFDNIAWTKQNSIAVTANTATSPDGYTNADTLEKASGSGGSNYYYIVDNYTSDTTNTFSVFAKYKTGSGILWLLGKNSGSFAYFNLQAGTALSASAGMTTKIEDYGNGWYRCSFTQDYTGAAEYTFGIGLSLADGTPNYDATSAATQGAYIYGAQFEAGSYATSYIPTLGASVTRGADYASKTGISSLIGQTEGTLFVEVNQFGGQENSPYLLASDGTFDNRIQISSGGSGTENSFTFYINVGGVNTVLYLSPTAYTGVHKLAIAYKLNDVVGYIDGVQVLNDTSSTIPATTTLEIGRSPSNPVNAGINQALLFKTRLSNADLATLTSL